MVVVGGLGQMAPLLLPLLLGATALRQSELAAPSALLVDLMHPQPPPLLLVTASARPSFSFLSGSSVMTHYRIVVTDLAGSVGWDSGRSEASSPVASRSAVAPRRTLIGK